MKKNVNTEELAVEPRTICGHVDVTQPDGSIARFHCRVPAPPLAPDVKAPGLLERIWRGMVGKPLTRNEIKRLD